MNGLIDKAQETHEKRTETHACDCISRQAVLGLPRTVTRNLFGEIVEESISVKEIEALPSAEPEQRWIPCSERLPEEKDAGILKTLGIEKRSEHVLATVEVKGERMTVTACTHNGKWYWNMKCAFPDYKVVAWMPLPEPYRK